jgi:hypothetical protein
MEIIKNIKYPLIIILTFMIFGLISCEKDEDVAEYERPVVEAYLVPGKALKLKVYYQKYLEDTLSYGYVISGLSVKITEGTHTITLTEGKPGTYNYSDTTFIQENKKYTMTFTFLEKEINASTVVPSKPVNFSASSNQQQVPEMSFGGTPTVFSPVTFTWTNPNDGYYMISFQNVSQYPKSISRNPSLNTEVLVNQVSTYATDQMNFNYTGPHKVILFHINKEYSDAMIASGRNSLNLTNPATNITNGLGIFTGLTPDSLDLYVYQ